MILMNQHLLSRCSVLHRFTVGFMFWFRSGNLIRPLPEVFLQPRRHRTFSNSGKRLVTSLVSGAPADPPVEPADGAAAASCSGGCGASGSSVGGADTPPDDLALQPVRTSHINKQLTADKPDQVSHLAPIPYLV